VRPEPGCTKEQFAVQIFNIMPDQKRYLINKNIWSAASSRIKAGLVLHELIYRDAVEAEDQTDSDKARYLNAQISSTHFSTITPDEYLNLLGSANFFLQSGRFSIYRDRLPINYYFTANDASKQRYLETFENPKKTYIETARLAQNGLTYATQGKTWRLSDGYQTVYLSTPINEFSKNAWKLLFALVDTNVTIQNTSIPLSQVPVSFKSDPNGEIDLFLMALTKVKDHYETLLDSDQHYPSLILAGNTYPNIKNVGIAIPQSQLGLYFNSLTLSAEKTGPFSITVGQIKIPVANDDQLVLFFDEKENMNGYCFNDTNSHEAQIENQKILGNNCGYRVQPGDQVHFNTDQSIRFTSTSEMDFQNTTGSFKIPPYSQITLFPDGSVKTALLKENVSVPVFGQSPLTNEFTFYPSGKLKLFRNEQAVLYPTLGGEKLTAEAQPQELIALYEDGSLKASSFSQDFKLFVGRKNTTLYASRDEFAYFYPNGKLAVGDVQFSRSEVSPLCEKAGLCSAPEKNQSGLRVFDQQGRVCYVPFEFSSTLLIKGHDQYHPDFDLEHTLQILNQP